MKGDKEKEKRPDSFNFKLENSKLGTYFNKNEKIRPTGDQIGTFSDSDGQKFKTGRTEKESSRKQVDLGESFRERESEIVWTNGTRVIAPKLEWTNGT